MHTIGIAYYSDFFPCKVRSFHVSNIQIRAFLKKEQPFKPHAPNRCSLLKHRHKELSDISVVSSGLLFSTQPDFSPPPSLFCPACVDGVSQL